MSTLQDAVNGEMRQVDDCLVSIKLTLNCSKTKFMVLTRSHEYQQIKINVAGGAVEKVTRLNTLEPLLITNWNGNSK